MNGQAPVGYVSPKYLKRVPGGAPGMVQMTQSQGTLYGDPDRGLQFIEAFSPKDTS